LTRLLICTACLLAAGEAAAACPQDVVWPGSDWAEALAPAGPAVDALDEYLFTLVGADDERLGIRTDGVVIVHRGRIIHERYARGYGRDNRHLAWSVSKSFLNAMVGVGVLRGDLALDDSICDHYLTPAADDEVCEISVDDLLGWGSGLDWNEGYESEPYYLSSVIAMLYGVGAGDMAAFTAAQGLEVPPGTRYRYSSGDSTLLAAVLAGALEPSLADSYPWDFVFDPIGMDSAVFERDRAGTFVGSSYVYATPRDLARFGYLFLRDGCWAGERLLPEGWVALSTEPNPSFLASDNDEWAASGDAVPGRHWWLGLPLPDRMHESVWPSAPPDTYAAEGHWGQSIHVIPSADLVIVRTADDRDTTAVDDDRFLALALALAAEDPP
jgi:CubicO group peptidase (beta-lactamase class C family)